MKMKLMAALSAGTLAAVGVGFGVKRFLANPYRISMTDDVTIIGDSNCGHMGTALRIEGRPGEPNAIKPPPRRQPASMVPSFHFGPENGTPSTGDSIRHDVSLWNTETGLWLSAHREAGFRYVDVDVGKRRTFFPAYVRIYVQNSPYLGSAANYGVVGPISQRLFNALKTLTRHLALYQPSWEKTKASCPVPVIQGTDSHGKQIVKMEPLITKVIPDPYRIGVSTNDPKLTRQLEKEMNP